MTDRNAPTSERGPFGPVLRAGLTALLVFALPMTAAAQVSNEGWQARRYELDIPAQELGAALNELSRTSHSQISAASSVLEGMTSNAVSGWYSAEEALERMVTGTGLRVSRIGDGSYTLSVPQASRAPADSRLDEVIVEGYVGNQEVAIGPWANRSLQDTPYSINVMSRELIEDLQATRADQLFEINPVTQVTWPQVQNGYPRIYLRGFQYDESAKNGVIQSTYAQGIIMEEIERVEVLTGLSGFLYGGGNVGGITNYVTKRPTAERFNSVTLGNTTGENLYLHGDFGGQFDAAGTFRYRVNLVTQDGETHIDNLDMERDSVSAAFDWQATRDLLLTLDLSWRHYRTNGRQAYWFLAPGVDRPDAEEIDSSKTWGQKWTSQNVDSARAALSANWKVSDAVTFRARYLEGRNERDFVTASNTIQADGTYDQSTAGVAPGRYAMRGGYAYLDFSFNTGSISHTLTTGLQVNRVDYEIHPDDDSVSFDFAGFSLDSPTYVPETLWPAYGTQPRYHFWRREYRTLTVGDDIRLNERWSVLAGISHAEVRYDRYTPAGMQTQQYHKDSITPTLSVLFKPLDVLTTYFSHMEGLERGGTAGETFGARVVINRGEVMEPLASEQIEIGAKATLGGTLLTAALFEIDKPLEYYRIINSTEAEFVQDGRQVHKGLEITAIGNLTDNISVVGGITLLDARIRDNEEEPEMEGKTPYGVSERMYKVRLEYALPGIPGLTLNGGIRHTGDYNGFDLDTDRIDGYTLVDIGARYAIDALNVPVTLRLNINNVTDERYWANDLFLGDARTVALSANLQF